MSDVVIRVEGVSKLYRLGEVGTGSLAHDVNRWWHRVRGKEDPYLKIGEVNDRTKSVSSVQRPESSAKNANALDPRRSSLNSSAPSLDSRPSTLVSAPPASDWVYALKDVSFEVKRGEVLGIIGRNGAGKSTLLKILSRVTTQSEGQIKVKGRIASLLEVGTGFHPELTGRENIFLNGAILGMRKAEIARKFDEIVDFSGCARYIDTPVKRYSSGMYVRLAFAVAAHLEPEILIVDEVLAVGDAEFQKKCLGKMKDVAGHGRTILFVSHNMGMIQSLCNRGVLFSQGRLMMEGETDRVVDVYLNELNNMADIELAERQDRLGNGSVRLVKAQAFSANGSPTLMTSRPARFEFEVTQHIPDMDFCFTIYNYNGHGLAHFHTANISNKISLGKKIICHVESLMLMPGTYRLNAGVLLHGDFLDNIASVLIFDVEPDPAAGRSHLVNTGKWDIFLPHAWEVSGQ